MIDDKGFEWGLAILRRNPRTGQEAWEHHRHYNQDAARASLREEHRRMGRGVVKTVAVKLVKRQVGDWQVVTDDDD